MLLHASRRLRMNVRGPTIVSVHSQMRESEMPIVVLDVRKGKSGRSEGALL